LREKDLTNHAKIIRCNARALQNWGFGIFSRESDREDDRGSLLEAIALQYSHFKQFDQAFQVANTLREKQTREQAIERIQCAARV
jgi:hypothetical protein